MPITAPPNPLTSWADLQARFATYDHRWAFHEMGSATRQLQTSLERLLVSPVVEAERYLLTAFQRRAHHHVRDSGSGPLFGRAGLDVASSCANTKRFRNSALDT